MRIDPGVSPYVSELFAENLDANPDDVPDPFEKFRSDGALAAAFRFRGHERVARLREETADLDKHFVEVMSADRLNNIHWQKAPSASEDLEATLMDETRLEKRFTGGKKAARVQKSANGKWTLEFDEDGELIRGYTVEAE